MSNGSDETFRLRLKLAIERGGGPSEVSKKTGIPLGTIKKYVAETSTASFTNAAKIALAAGFPLEMMAFGAGMPIDEQMGPGFVSSLPLGGQPARPIEPFVLKAIDEAITRAHQAAGIVLPHSANIDLISTYYNEFVMDQVDLKDREEVEARAVLLRKRLERELDAAKKDPGTGKRSAS